MTAYLVSQLIAEGVLRVEDGNHGNNRPRPEEFTANGVAFIRAADMTSGVVDFHAAGKINEVARDRIRKGVGKPGDVILSHKGTVGRVAKVPLDAPEFVCSPQTTFWRTLDESRLNRGFLPYLLQSDPFQRQLRLLGGQTDMAPYVSLTDQRSMRLEIPELTQQRAIAEVLGALDDKIAANDRLVRSADDLSASTYARLTSKLPVLPMSDVLDPVLGGTPSRARADYWDAGLQNWVSAVDITGAPAGVVLGTRERITELAVAETKAKPLPVGSVILTARGTVGAVARLAEPSSFNQSCYGFIPDRIPPACLYRSVLRAVPDARSLAHGSVFDTITKSTFQHMFVPDPEDWWPIEEAIAPLHDLIDSYLRQNVVLATLRDTLLPALMSGRLSVKDAENTVSEVV